MEQQDRYRFKWWALLGVCLLAFTAFLDVTIVNTALPFIQEALKCTILQLQWIANIFAIVLSMTMIAVGKLADFLGRRRVFYAGVALFALAALGAGSSSTTLELVIFRGLQSLGAATIFVASNALLSHVFPKEERVRAISIYAGVTGFGLLIGPFVGGLLIELLGWRWVFWINLPMIALGLCACSFSLQAEPKQKSSASIDGRGLFLLIFGLGSFLYGIIAGAEGDWKSVSGWVFLTFGALALALLIAIDARRKDALLDLHIFKKRLVALAALSCALGGVASTVFMFFDPLYLKILRQLKPFLIGLLVGVIPAAQVLISFVFRRLEKRFGIAALLIFSIASALLAAVLHRMLQGHTSLFFLVAPFFLLGINWGLSNAGLITAVSEAISSRKIGAALGTIMTIWNVSGAVMLAASTAIFHAVEVRSSFLPAFHKMVDFNIAFAALVLTCAIALEIKLKKSNRSLESGS